MLSDGNDAVCHIPWPFAYNGAPNTGGAMEKGDENSNHPFLFKVFSHK